MLTRSWCLATALIGLFLSAPRLALAADPPPPVAPAAEQDDEDRTVQPAQPDFTLVNLPTTLRLPRMKSAFRVTHRFTRPLGQGDFGDLANDVFGLDSSAEVGLEYRFGVLRGGQIGILRTAGRKTIEFFGEYDLTRHMAPLPVSLGVVATVEGIDNFRDHYAPSIGLVVSRTLGGSGAVYVEPIWVGNSALQNAFGDQDNTLMLGLGGRLQVRPNLYLVGEVIPRVAGYGPGGPQGAFGVEKRVGGHSFQLNFSNAFGVTMAQIARGASGSDDWYVGFNISRKFF